MDPSAGQSEWSRSVCVVVVRAKVAGRFVHCKIVGKLSAQWRCMVGVEQEGVVSSSGIYSQVDVCDFSDKG